MTSAPVKLTRERFKAAREGRPYDPPAVHADRLLALLTPAAESDPAPASWAYREYVHAHFSDRFLELCSRYPVPVRRLR